MHVRKKSLLPIILSIVLCLAIAVAVGMYIGVFDDRDSFFYAVLGEFLYFKRNIPLQPFIADPPQTLFGPIFALIILPLSYIPAPGGMLALPTVQMLMIFASAAAVAYIASKIFSPRLTWVTALLLVLFPFTVPYATVMMSEITTMLLVAIYTLLLYGWVYKRWRFANLSSMLLISAILVLTRYVFVPLFFVTFLLFFFLPVEKAPAFRLGGIVGILLIFGWILFNFRLHGIIGLSNVTGRHIYNNVVSAAHILPPFPNPKTNFFMFRMLKNMQRYPDILTAPWWNSQWVFNDGIITQKLMDQMYMDAAMLAILNHPFQYIANAIREFVIISITAPLYPDSAIKLLKQCPLNQCAFDWNKYLCTPAIANCSVRSAFASIVEWEQTLYPYAMVIIFVIVCIGIVTSFVHGPLFMRFVAGIFVMQLLFQAGTEWVEGRFLIPLYPLYILLMLYGSKMILGMSISMIRKKRK